MSKFEAWFVDLRKRANLVGLWLEPLSYLEKRRYAIN